MHAIRETSMRINGRRVSVFSGTNLQADLVLDDERKRAGFRQVLSGDAELDALVRKLAFDEIARMKKGGE